MVLHSLSLCHGGVLFKDKFLQGEEWWRLSFKLSMDHDVAISMVSHKTTVYKDTRYARSQFNQIIIHLFTSGAITIKILQQLSPFIFIVSPLTRQITIHAHLTSQSSQILSKRTSSFTRVRISISSLTVTCN